MEDRSADTEAKQASIRRFVAVWVAIGAIWVFYSTRTFCARELYNWGFYYKKLGWTEGSRALLSLSELIGGDAPEGLAARRYLHTKVPRYPQPEEAVRLNILGYNADNGNHNIDQAQAYFEECIRRYPNFEWPLANVATIYYRRGQLDKAEAAAAKAVSINPEYVNGWLVYSTVKAGQGDQKAALEYAERASKLDPDNPDLQSQAESATAARQQTSQPR